MKNHKNYRSLEYLIEVSWEVCNKIGGIHTMVATKSILLKKELGDKIIVIGPLLWKQSGETSEFEEDKTLFPEWLLHTKDQGLSIKIGRWKIKSRPIAILVDFSPCLKYKDQIFKEFYDDFKVDSLKGEWDYIEPAMFGHAAGMVIKNFYDFYLHGNKVVAHFHEWMSVAGALFLKKEVPEIATVFTTHGTVLGRSLATHDTLHQNQISIDADNEARKLNIISKHTLEKSGAHHADSFSSVSAMMAEECERFLNKKPEITPNGFDLDLVPQINDLEVLRRGSRKLLLDVYEAVTGIRLVDNVFIMHTSGRYEYKNKGYDLFLDVLDDLNKQDIRRDVVAFIMVPAGNTGPKEFIINRLNGAKNSPIQTRNFLTHYLKNEESDLILKQLNRSGIANKNSKVHVLFIPSYLNGSDGIFNLPYYDLLTGSDLSVFPSSYEPWGYTPLESLAFMVPTVTSTLTGFGQWLKEKNDPEQGLEALVVHRNKDNYEKVVTDIVSHVIALLQVSQEEYENVRARSREISKVALWQDQLKAYVKIYDKVLHDVQGRKDQFRTGLKSKRGTQRIGDIPENNLPSWRRIFVETHLPDSLKPLLEISQNVWWTWNREFLHLLRKIDMDLWMRVQNPVAFMRLVTQEKLEAFSVDKVFIQNVNRVYQSFQTYLSQPKADSPTIAYFSMEYGLDASIRLYSGGLGILAGDYLKQASDDKVNLVAVGLLYQYGYFKQQLSLEGDQISQDDENKFTHLPISPVRDQDNHWILIELPFPGRKVHAKIWKLAVGRVLLYLLDTNIPENNEQDQSITDRLYGGDIEHRLQQEIVLGIGGTKLLRALKIEPDVFHLNEGHAAFAGLERIQYLMDIHNLTYDQALELVRSSSLFTTHTPVPAGHDSFNEDLIRIYLGYYAESYQIEWTDFIGLGRSNKIEHEEKFSMSCLAIRLSARINGVSKIHGEVSREMFNHLWKAFDVSEVPIEYITNGVHLGTWATDGFKKLLDESLGEEYHAHQQDSKSWTKIDNIPDEVIRKIRLDHKRKLIDYIKGTLNHRILQQPHMMGYFKQVIQQLTETTLIIGFARRFATYKRALLLFQDIEHLKQILSVADKPVLFLFSGKAHPADKEGQGLIRRIVEISKMPDFVGKVLFLENYNMHLASLLVSGVDVWMNTPARPLEASGTSGMKAVMNGVLNLSVLDGWWAEAWCEEVGWALPEKPNYQDNMQQDHLDALTIYSILESELIPLYYRDNEVISADWIKKIRSTFKHVVPGFTTRRMISQYQKIYAELAIRQVSLKENNFQLLLNLSIWKRKIYLAWDSLETERVAVDDYENKSVIYGEKIHFMVRLKMDEITERDVQVTVVLTKKTQGKSIPVMIQELGFDSKEGNIYTFITAIEAKFSGVHRFAFRVIPKHSFFDNPADLNIVRWF